MFKINGNQTEFTQWEQGKTLTNPDMAKGDAVQFYSGSGESAIMYAKEEGGTVVVEVPNSILQHAGNFTARLVKGGGSTTFAVKEAKKPADYVIIDNEQPAEKTSGGGVSSWNDLTDKPFYKTESEAYILDCCEWERDGYMYQTLTTTLPTVGEIYTVTYNNVEYNLPTLSHEGMVGFGNQAMFGGEDSGEPFAMAFRPIDNTNNIVMFMPMDDATEIDVKIKGKVLDIKKLDETFYDAPCYFYIGGGKELFHDAMQTRLVTYGELVNASKKSIVIINTQSSSREFPVYMTFEDNYGVLYTLNVSTNKNTVDGVYAYYTAEYYD